MAANPAASATPRQTAGTIRIRALLRTMTITAEKLSTIQSASASPTSERPPESESDTMMPMPARTAAIAAQVGPGTRSPITAQPRSAAISGAPACISRMLATELYCRAMTKQAVELPKSIATTRPGSPIAGKSRSVPRGPSRTSMNASRNAAAKAERQKTMAQGSRPSPRSRPKLPPKLQAMADARISHPPVREVAGAEGGRCMAALWTSARRRQAWPRDAWEGAAGARAAACPLLENR